MTDTIAPAESLTPASRAPTSLAVTPLHALHVARGARMMPFAGYDMPVQYADGILAEHHHTRTHAGLFDVSHMGQAFLVGPDHETTARALEALVPADIVGLPLGRLRYTQFLNGEGGILDDLMVTRSADPSEDGALMLVVNAARKDADFAHLAASLPRAVRLLRAEHRALIALQGPQASTVLARHCAETATMPFMSAISTRFDGIECHVLLPVRGPVRGRWPRHLAGPPAPGGDREQGTSWPKSIDWGDPYPNAVIIRAVGIIPAGTRIPPGDEHIAFDRAVAQWRHLLRDWLAVAAEGPTDFLTGSTTAQPSGDRQSTATRKLRISPIRSATATDLGACQHGNGHMR